MARSRDPLPLQLRNGKRAQANRGGQPSAPLLVLNAALICIETRVGGSVSYKRLNISDLSLSQLFGVESLARGRRETGCYKSLCSVAWPVSPPLVRPIRLERTKLQPSFGITQPLLHHPRATSHEVVARSSSSRRPFRHLRCRTRVG